MTDYFKNPNSDWYKPRLTVTMASVIAVFCILSVRLFYLQISEGENFRWISENNCIRLQNLPAMRGQIYDKNGNLLVDNRPSFDLAIVMKDAHPVDKTIGKLAAYTRIPVNDLKKAIDLNNRGAHYNKVLLTRDIGWDTLAPVEVNKYDLPGIVVNVNSKRHYIHSDSASHILGYLSEINPAELKNGKFAGAKSGDLVGKYGVEKAAEQYLRGKPGKQLVEVDARGRVIRVLNTEHAISGANVYLTIDSELQQRAEFLMQGKTGAVVALEPDTGHVLALVSSPSFDPNAFIGGISHKDWKALVSNPLRPLENKVIQALYPPASTYKIVTAIAGLEENIIDSNTKIYCPGHYKFGDRIFRCWKKSGHGSVDVVQALAQSCDVFFYQVGQKLGVDRLARYAIKCGLGKETGIQLEPEAKGLIPTRAWKKKRKGKPWRQGETLSVAIGQGYNLTTPLQMAVLTAAVANGGKILKPHIIREVRGPTGEMIWSAETKGAGRLPASVKTLDIVRDGLWHVVNGPRGTARIARIENMEISGKTGTAQVVSRKKNETGDDRNLPAHLRAHAWFVAYAPSQNAKIAVVVFVEHGEKGSGTAGPIARDLIKAYFRPPIIRTPANIATNLHLH
jgi:penicillin-binding protein 2